jgi:kynureninase
MPKRAKRIVEQELHDWQNLAVEAHFRGKTPWYSYHEVFRESGARLVGAEPGEVVDDELADGEPAPVFRQLLSPHRAALQDPDRGAAVPFR